MTNISRSFQAQIEARLEEKAPLIQVLIGPRQVGKTTAIQNILASRSRLYETADSPVPLPHSEIERLWNEASRMKNPILAIDEVQKIDGWAETVKRLWDKRSSPIKLILLGSAALAIEKNLKESLAGRYELIRVEHWNLEEAQTGFATSIEKFIEFGCYPGSMNLIEDLSRWGAYIRDSIVEPAIGRDILQLSPVENPALLRQVFSVCLCHPAQVISLNKIQGQLQDKGALATIQHYIDLLSLGFMVTGIQKYSSQVIRTKSSPPKIIIHDNALIRAFERPIQESPSRERMGFYFENAVGSRLIEAGWDTYYWKDRNLEVDFVAIGPNGEKWAIEVKLTAPDERDLKGLKVFCERNPEFTPCVVCPEPVAIRNINSISAASILSLKRT